MLLRILNGIHSLGGYNESFLLDVYYLFKRITKKKKLDYDMNDAYEFYSSLISSVEIEKDDHIEKCFFQIPTCMIFLNQELRNKLIYKVNRNSTEEKIKSFLFLSEEIQLELHHLQALSRIRFIGWIISRYDSIANLLYFAIVCVNVILIFTVSSVNDRDYNTSSFPGTDLMNILGIFIIFLSVIMYSLSILFSYPVIIFKTFHADFESNLFQSDKNGDMAGTVKMDFVVEKLSKEKGEVVTKYGRFFIYVILNLENFFKVVIILFAGLGWYNPFFYAILLLDILRRSDTLKNVLLVITKNGKSLSLTVVLLCIIVYVYGV